MSADDKNEILIILAPSALEGLRRSRQKRMAYGLPAPLLRV
jgi:hypothetical protein